MDISETVCAPNRAWFRQRLLAFTEAADVVEPGGPLVYDLSRRQKKGDQITGTV